RVRRVARQRLAGGIGPALPDDLGPLLHSQLGGSAGTDPRLVVLLTVAWVHDRPQTRTSVPVNDGHDEARSSLDDAAVHRRRENVVGLVNDAFRLVDVDLSLTPVCVWRGPKEILRFTHWHAVIVGLGQGVAESWVQPQAVEVLSVFRCGIFRLRRNRLQFGGI